MENVFSTPYSYFVAARYSAHCGGIRKTALLAKRTLKLIVVEQRPKQLMKPEMQLKLDLLSEQGHVMEPESINTLSMDYTEMISQRKA